MDRVFLRIFRGSSGGHHSARQTQLVLLCYCDSWVAIVGRMTRGCFSVVGQFETRIPSAAMKPASIWRSYGSAEQFAAKVIPNAKELTSGAKARFIFSDLRHDW